MSDSNKVIFFKRRSFFNKNKKKTAFEVLQRQNFIIKP